MTERRNNIGLPTPPLLTPHRQPWQFLHPLQPPQRASVPFFSWPRAVKEKQSLAENSASNNLSAVGPSCNESRPPLSLSITPPLTLLRSFVQPCPLPNVSPPRNFLRLPSSRRKFHVHADFRATLAEILSPFLRQTRWEKICNERSG